jgi:hypothetical protein
VAQFHAADSRYAGEVDSGQFLVVVEPKPFDEADRDFERWLAEHQMDRTQLSDDDIRIDFVRVLDGSSKKRYLIRRTAIAP